MSRAGMRSSAAGGHVAPWWQANNQGGDNDVVAHTPDPTKYHSTSSDGDQANKLGHGPRGLMGAVIPRARNDGSSRGFDHNRAGVVVVDPNAPDGGVVLDLDNLQNAETQDALEQVGYNVGYGRETDQETYAAIAMLSKPISEATLEDVTPEYLIDSVASGPVKRAADQAVNQMRSNRYAPNSYVTPRGDSEGRQRHDLGTSANRPVRRRVEPVRDEPVARPAPQRRAPAHAKPAPQPQRRAVTRPQPTAPVLDVEPEYEEKLPYEEEAPVMAKQGSARPAQRPAPQQPARRPAARPQPVAEEVEVDPLELLTKLAASQGMKLAPARPQPRRRVAELPPEEEAYDEQPEAFVDEDEEILDEQEVDFPPQAQAPRRAQQPAHRHPPTSAIHRPGTPTPRQGRAQAPQRRPVPRQRPQEQFYEEDAPEAAQRGPDMGELFSALALSFVSGVEAEKPKKTAVFDLGPGGILRKRYHEIIQGADCVVLVYDTRYEDGEQWVPPQTDEAFTVAIPDAKKAGKPGDPIAVRSFGLQFSLGCMDVIVLVNAEDAAPEHALMGDADEEDLNG